MAWYVVGAMLVVAAGVSAGWGLKLLVSGRSGCPEGVAAGVSAGWGLKPGDGNGDSGSDASQPASQPAGG